MKAKLTKIANRLVEIEKECRAGINVSENMELMEKITSNLSADEMLLIDEYITENNLLT